MPFDPIRPPRARRALVACLLALAPSLAGAQPLPPYPPTEKKPVTDTYHGVAVTEDYRWLEDDASPEVKAWAAAQNAYAHRYLDALPERPAIARRVGELLRQRAYNHRDFAFRGGKLFAMKSQPPRNQPRLVWMTSPAAASLAHTVVDPLSLDAKGRTTIDFYRPSFDGRHVVVSLSENGSEAGTAYVYDVATGKRLPDRLPGVMYPTAGGSVEWSPDNAGFYYTRYPQGDEKPKDERQFWQQVWYHRLGTPVETDQYVLGREFPKIAEIELAASRDGRVLLATVRNGDGGDVAFHLRDALGAWHAVAGFDDGVKQAAIGADGRLYLKTVKDAPLGRIVAVPVERPLLANAVEVVPQADLALQYFTVAGKRLYLNYLAGGPSAIRVVDLAGKRLPDVPVPPVTSAYVEERLAGDDVLINVSGYTLPPTWYRYDAARGRLVRTTLAGRSPIDFSDAVVKRDFATAADGTKVPVTIVHRRGMALDGNNPVRLYAYGAYGLSQTPYYTPLTRLWLDWGGVLVVANLRGGGEYGETWHRAANLAKKQTTFDDLAASAQWLVDRRYTSPSRLAIQGGSAGGLLMGAALVQHPALFRAVVSQVGMYDALRWELLPNGEFNVTEFGTVKDPEQFKALYAYSPYHHVVDGTNYPAVLMTAGDNDGRVAPYESRKMVARLQAASASGLPVLLRTEAEGGHGQGTALSLRIEEEADVYAFLVHELGMKPAGKAPKR